MPGRFTVVGGRGFIGGSLVAFLRAAGHDVVIATHRDDLTARDLGHVIYASGIAASIAVDASYACESHVGGVVRIFAHSTFDSFLYLSSTRVYGTAHRTHESTPLEVDPAGTDVYRISKICGEALCLARSEQTVRVARLSNIVGPALHATTFLGDIMRQIAAGSRAVVRTDRSSSKDYLSIDDACRYLVGVASNGRHRVYNVASGHNTENGSIFDAVANCGGAIEIRPDAEIVRTVPIDARRLQDEFGLPCDDLIDMIPSLLAAYQRHAHVRP